MTPLPTRGTCLLGQFQAPSNSVEWELGISLYAWRGESAKKRTRGVLVLAENEERRQIQEAARTQVVNAHGGLLKMKSHLHVGQSFLLSNPRKSKEMSCRVVRVDDAGPESYKVAFEFDRPAPDFWPIVFPPADWSVPAKP